MITTEVEDIVRYTQVYLTNRVTEINRRIDVRSVHHAAVRGIYSKAAILELINQVDGSLRLAYVIGIVRMGEDFYDGIRVALDDARKAVNK